MRFSELVKNTHVDKGCVGVFWAGQAGYILKTQDEKLIALDLYLSDYCDRLVGFKRLMPYILETNELVFDGILISHAHPDHFDCDSIPAMLSKKTHMYCTEDCIPECEKLKITKGFTVIKQGDSFNCCGLKVRVVSCDHGASTPFAVGFVIETGAKRLYFMGDTTYREDYFNDEVKRNVDLLMAPINGAYGNLNEVQASKMAKGLNAKLTVPCHFWNFGEHGGNPDMFVKAMKEFATENKFYLLRIGEGIII